MKAIGGFFELEVPARGEAIHPAALRVTSGRAALLLALRRLRARRVHVPFYVCDAVLAAIAAAGAEAVFYPLTTGMEADVPAAPAADDCVVYVNYFGLQSETARHVAGQYGRTAVIDDTHAFYATGYPGAWSFNSARKFFGVPDGAYLFSPEPLAETLAPNDDVHAAHLLTRLNGQLQIAFAQYQDAERHITLELRGMSVITARLLAGINFTAIAERRRRSYQLLHERLGACNRLRLRGLPATAVPFCYPLLTSKRGLHARLWERNLFVPQLWPEVATRAVRGFEAERELTELLLPLPIDHRYDDHDMERLIGTVESLLA